MLVHASCVAFENRAVLLWGPSGCGKSDLALRLIERGAVLIADDYTELIEKKGKVYAFCPPSIQGKIEVRGIGILSFPFIQNIPVHLVIDLSPEKKIQRFPLEKIPLPSEIIYPLPCFRLRAFEASSPFKIKSLLTFLLEKKEEI